MKGSGVCPPFSMLTALAAESTRLVADTLIFMYIVPSFKREVAGHAQQARTRHRQRDGGRDALSCYTYLSKKERGKGKRGGS